MRATLWWWSVMLRYALRRTVLRAAVCSWRGHAPEEHASHSWGSITPMHWYPETDQIVVSETRHMHAKHNSVRCRRCRHVLSSATWEVIDG